MDVAEASKHGKKSTSQKLEDQKKVGRIFVFYFIFFFTPSRLAPTGALVLLSACSFFACLLGDAKSVSGKANPCESTYC